MTTPEANEGGWVWVPSHRAYYNAQWGTYAVPDAQGHWTYLPVASSSSTTTSTNTPSKSNPTSQTNKSTVPENEPPPSASDTSKGQNNEDNQDEKDHNKEDGEIEDDVGWGGLMDPEKLAEVVQNKQNLSSSLSSHPTINKQFPFLTKHPAYDDPSIYSFPAETDEPNDLVKMPGHILRLVVDRSDCLEVGQVAVIDAREGGIQLGRDRCERGGVARVRLREMEVSKTHGVVYWGKSGNVSPDEGDEEEEEEEEGWWVVDLGSTHGTFIKPPPKLVTAASSGSNGKGKARRDEIRLSEPKTSSRPHPLSHLSTLRIGSTIFICHIHPQWPCEVCQINRTNEIRLDDGQLPSPPPATSQPVPEVPWAMTSKEKRENRELKRKAEMASLKEVLLREEAGQGGKKKSGYMKKREYIDRSAIRRKMYPPSPPPRTRHGGQNESSRGGQNGDGMGPSKFSQAMLASQGWKPGTGLGKDGSGRSTPIEVELRAEKRGLGAKGAIVMTDVEGEGDWRLQAKRRRYDELKGNREV
ncbi:hypothetical protein TREMEDRAFT_67844 [Tremella mesenterica DSM 1558]|uniref:uncharacterized protein n=1 Tax=Tremella mesenterica (strain ATCC 24925 / CBS 8224 / DSM 1558 / NBRC 9311 / NRRL Y-6157 / RJB 2259-6 / UBC 559-6) TaxID=578456 RepID=UPI0003F49EAD|nr:uncharacterized protein TREMEDRAFT_67844 [Tremella mesenterica DSM 1558]EIW71573.1 hypothetical protein TREMEDRAFT_67844 [Tremella mesenterica DSM 1558]